MTQTSGQYGTLRDEVEAAIADRSAIYVLDFAFKSRAEFFAGVQHLAVRVVPESAEELERRLIACGRPERIPQAISDFNELIGQGERSDSPDFRRRS